MHTQKVRNTTEAINYTQSIAAIQTLLRAGLGSIAYLRNLLPEDNFASSHFTTARNESDQSFELESSQESSLGRNGNGFSIMTLARGYTDEADRLLNYLEYGIFDALENRYLRSFIFAVYLDNKDPNNILEAYTFNFKYYTIPGSDVTIPIMSLGENLRKMTVNGKTKKKEDPVAQAIRNGKTPTLKEVKMSVKTLLKTLITAMQKMELLPRRRFATFKIFYTDDTPLDYEPPYFQAGDMEKDKWYFMTHDFDEVPDRYSIGKLDTGHHGINITVTSITPYLPSSTDYDKEAFGGTVAHAGRMTLTPLQEVKLSKKLAEVQIEDATNRNVVWVADGDVLGDADAEAVDDPDYIRLEDGTYKAIDANPVPIGIRGHEGVIKPLSTQASAGEAQYAGIPERVPTKLQEMAAGRVLVGGEIEETQPLFTTPKNKARSPTGLALPHGHSLSPVVEPIFTPLNRTRGMEAGLINSGSSEKADVGMLDLETQRSVNSMDSIEPSSSFENIATTSPIVIDIEEGDNGLGCDCGIDIEDDSFFCEGGCNKWFHVWCMGYFSLKDPRIPPKFICFDCRARSDVNWDFMKLDIYPAMLRKLKDLTLFRRAIKIAERMKSFGPSEFNKAFGAIGATASQMVKQLEEEGFILKATVLLDDMGVTKHTTSRSKAKAKSKSIRPRRNVQKARYVFDFSVQSKDQYKDYFKPDEWKVESRLLGMLNSDSTTQTQEETQRMAEPRDSNAKRGPGNDEKAGRPMKRVKVSVTAGVDLAE